MTKAEWLAIGFDKGIIEPEIYDEITFEQVYKMWFCMKLKSIKKQSCDRIEVAYNRYYAGSLFIEKCISTITETDITDFLSGCILRAGNMTYKEFHRLFQIANNVLVYAKDLKLGGARLYDWDAIKRYLPMSAVNTGEKKEFAVSMDDVAKVTRLVAKHDIYPLKRSACLCLCMNFYLGLRIGELASLTFQDFDFERNVVKIYKTESKYYDRAEDGAKIGPMSYRVVEDTKTIYSVREVPLLPEVRYFYDKIKERHDLNGYESPYLAYDGTDTILVRSLDRTLRRLCKLCEVEYFNSHAIRKTFATKMHFGGVPTRVIADLMGHSEIATTEHNYILSFSNDNGKILQYMKKSLKYG